MLYTTVNTMIQERVADMRRFWDDDSSQTMFHDVLGATYVFATESDVRRGYVQAKTRRVLDDIVSTGEQNGFVGEEIEGLRTQIARYEPSTKDADHFTQTYLTLALGYGAVSLVVNSTEIGMHAKALEQNSAKLEVLSQVHGRLGASYFNPIVTVIGGMLLREKMRAQAVLSIVPVVGPLLALRNNAAQLASKEIPAIKEIANSNAARSLSRVTRWVGFNEKRMKKIMNWL